MLKLKTFSTNYSDVHTTFGKGPTKPFTSQRERKSDHINRRHATALEDLKAK